MSSGTCTMLEFNHKTFCAITYTRCYKLVRFKNEKLRNMTNDNKHQELSDSTDTAIDYSTCYAQPFAVNSDFRKLELKEKADLLIIDPPHDVFFHDILKYIDKHCKNDAIKIIIDSDKNILKYCDLFGSRFSFFMCHDFIFHIGNKSMPLRQFDLIAVFDYDSSKFNNLNDGFSNVIRCKSERMKGTDNLKHRHQKPIRLYDDLIKHFSNEGDLVLDYFIGSGMIIQSCINNNRRFVGAEKDKETFDKIFGLNFNKKTYSDAPTLF
jgi:DNA modification methylase